MKTQNFSSENDYMETPDRIIEMSQSFNMFDFFHFNPWYITWSEIEPKPNENSLQNSWFGIN